MSDKYYYVGGDEFGGRYKVKLRDNSDGTFSLPHSCQTVIPADYPTTSAVFADVPGASLDTQGEANLSITISNPGAQTIKWQVLADNRPDFSTGQIVKVSATIAAAALDTYAVSGAPYRYYKVQAADNVGGQHGTAHVAMVSKG